MTKTAEKTFTEKEYESHGDMMYEIGKQQAFKSVLKTEVSWSVKMPDDNWNLDTIIIGDGSLKDIIFIKEVWLAADRAYKEAVKLYGDWHYFLEIVELKGRKTKIIYSYYGS